jgi:hypothetical protein
MANRTTFTEVQIIMDTALEDAEITSLIGYANRMVNSVLGTAGLTDELLKDIETYLTGHLIATGKERQTGEEKVHDISVKYTGKYGEQLRMTSFGQQVLLLDTTGNFANLGKQTVSIKAIPQYPENYD